MASIRHTVRIGLNVVRSVHVAQFNGVHTTLGSGVVSIVHVAKTRWCPYDTSLCRETRWRPYDTQCTFIRHCISASCIVCTSRNPMSPIRHSVDVYMTYVSASSVIHNSLADMRHTTQHTVHVHTTLRLGVFCTSRNLMASIRATVHVQRHTSSRRAYYARRETR